MKFDEWFDKEYPKDSISPEVMRMAFRELAEKAWTNAILSSFDARERVVILELMQSKDMSAHGILRMALRIYQLRDHWAKKGYETIRFQARDGSLEPQMSKLPPEELQ